MSVTQRLISYAAIALLVLSTTGCVHNRARPSSGGYNSGATRSAPAPQFTVPTVRAPACYWKPVFSNTGYVVSYAQKCY